MSTKATLPRQCGHKTPRTGWEWANEVREVWNRGQPKQAASTYANHATGLEPVEVIHGHELWRLKRLRDLKAMYDPSDRLRYYNPIIGGT
ncbi:uncharacterized protein GLRG_11564 [Colletotrichum graminicola M1.001]|uniref:Berberine/berberine-like domain-containing protein n=1 Tax=Colletotrichum graminicola (strain M1.001 / M2 / FGSC 10212) TaxID=645133 RepID=E3QZV8_COLGM|nr:uncharacterized protein GLRG_11564 [Colletotrichum graminicola M1.001]EFQ36396.1 hypothetical protein GLRG_11564 [Colletotrichum graminicola M1.001]